VRRAVTAADADGHGIHGYIRAHHAYHFAVTENGRGDGQRIHGVLALRPVIVHILYRGVGIDVQPRFVTRDNVPISVYGVVYPFLVHIGGDDYIPVVILHIRQHKPSAWRARIRLRKLGIASVERLRLKDGPRVEHRVVCKQRVYQPAYAFTRVYGRFIQILDYNRHHRHGAAHVLYLPRQVRGVYLD
jgi:hypothetical protein